tara:strand:- start:2408 stop:2779 length:372 start_codon:yes stop_codon:yes gene_type:complete
MTNNETPAAGSAAGSAALSGADWSPDSVGTWATHHLLLYIDNTHHELRKFVQRAQRHATWPAQGRARDMRAAFESALAQWSRLDSEQHTGRDALATVLREMFSLIEWQEVADHYAAKLPEVQR